MSFFMRASSEKGPAAYLLEGLLPNLARYLAGTSTYSTKRLAKSDRHKNNEETTVNEIKPIKCSSTKGCLDSPARPSSTFVQPLEAQSPSGQGNLDTVAHLSRSELLPSFEIPPAKRPNRRSLPALTLNHSRNVSISSDETLVWSPSGPLTSTPPAASRLDQEWQDAAERVVRQKQTDEIRRLNEVVGELRHEKEGETQRAEGLQNDLAVSETSRQMSLNMAIQYYQTQGNFLDVENLTERIHQMRLEIRWRDDVIWERDELIRSRDELIEALGRDVVLYSDQDHWHLMQRRFWELQQRYQQMPADLRSLERRHGDLQDDHVDLSRRYRNLEADLTVLRAQLSQVQDERDQFEYDASIAEQQSGNAVSRYREMKAERDQILIQKAESEEQSGAKERLMADLASRMFKRTIILSCMLDDLEVEAYDDELASICQLAQEHLGIDYKALYKDFVVAKARTKRDREAGGAGEERGGGDVPEAHAGDASSSAAASNSNQQEPNIRLAGSDVLESPNTYDARRRREVAAAEEAILGPLGLGFEDGSPTLKSMPIPEGSKSSKPPRMKNLLPTSPTTPVKIRGGLFTSDADHLDQVTPARTGGTRGIARDQWQIAADDLHELTEVFRGPPAQPVDIVSPVADVQATDEEAEGSGGDREESSSASEGDAFLRPNEDIVYENDRVKEMEVEGESVVGSSSPNTSVAEGSRVFQDLRMNNENVQQGAGAVPDLLKHAFNAPRFEDFKFGKSSGAIIFTGSGNEPSALTEGTSAFTTSGVFSSSSASTQAPVNADDPPPFEQNFNFGGSNSAVSFTASQNAPSCLPTSAPELQLAAVYSVPDTSLAEDSPAVTAQAEDEVQNQQASDKAIEEDSKADELSPNKQTKKKAKAKAKKAQEKAQKTEERKEAALNAKGPNRSQRRAASRERKATEKKAQAEAKKAQSATTKAAERRRVVTVAMMGA